MAVRSGGIRRLGRLLDERWEALEADFASVYGIDLAPALWVEHRGLRWFKVRVDGLPTSARVWHREHGGWTVADHHLATIAMQLNSVYRQSLAAAGMKERELPPPLRITRPGPKPPRNHWIKDWAAAATGRR